MGSITSLRRSGLSTNQPNTYGVIDNLSLSYSGNQLSKVTDLNSREPLYNGAFHFQDGSNQTIEYYYDQNGNVTRDLNKKISKIQYNPLNLPAQVLFENNCQTEYVYDASAVKRQVRHIMLPTIYPFQPGEQAGGIMLSRSVTTDYCANVVYESGVLKRILTDEGYITLESGMPVYHYYLKDYLGNNRLVVKQGGTVEEVNHYYPYGGLFGEGISTGKQPYKFSGKEFDRVHGLDMYDFSARTQDPGVPRFTTMDPMAEEYYPMSPYIYCGDNPIKYIDPTGEDYWSTNDPKEIERFIRALQSKYARPLEYCSNTLNFANWEHATDDQVAESLTYNDQNQTFYFSYGQVINNEPTIIGVMIQATRADEKMAWIQECRPDPGLIEQDNILFDLILGGGTKAGWGLIKGVFSRGSSYPEASTFGVRSGKASSRGMPHGDNGRSLQQAEERIEELTEKMKGATVKEKGKINKKIKNIREIAQKKNKGETHWH